jgi:hypothetical protein
MKGISKGGGQRCLVPVIGGLNLYVVPQGAGCSDLLQCLPDVGSPRLTSPSNGWAFSPSMCACVNGRVCSGTVDPGPRF